MITLSCGHKVEGDYWAIDYTVMTIDHDDNALVPASCHATACDACKDEMQRCGLLENAERVVVQCEKQNRR